jgi:hypothetical protein
LSEAEVKLAQGLLEVTKHMSGSEETQKRINDNKVARRWKVGLAGVAGAAVIGITGGLAAPLVAGQSCSRSAEPTRGLPRFTVPKSCLEWMIPELSSQIPNLSFNT